MDNPINILHWCGVIGIFLELLALVLLHGRHIAWSRWVTCAVWGTGLIISFVSLWFSYMLEEGVKILGVPFMFAAFERQPDGQWWDFPGHFELIIWNYVFWLLLPQLVYGSGAQLITFLFRKSPQTAKPNSDPMTES